MFITCFLLTVYVHQTLVLLYLLYRLFTNSMAKIYNIFILYIFNDCTMSRKTFGISLFAVCILCMQLSLSAIQMGARILCL